MLTAVSLTPLTVGLIAGQLRDDLGLAATWLGIVTAAQWTGTAISAWLVAPYADVWGWRSASVLGLLVSAVGQFGAGLAAPSGPVLAGWLLLAGLGYGLVTPTSNVVVVSEVPPARRGLVIGTKQAAPPLAGVIAGVAVPALTLALGWRSAFVALGILGLLAAGYSAWASQGVARPVPTTQVQKNGSSAVTVLVIGALASLPIGAIIAFTAISLEGAGLGPTQAGLVVGAASAASLLTRIGGGWWADRSGSEGFGPAARLVAAGTVGLVLLGSGSVPLMVVGAVLSFATAWGWPALFILGLLQRSTGSSAKVTGRLAIGAGAGAALGPVLWSAVAGPWSASAAWCVLALVTVPAIPLILRLRAPVAQP